LFIMSSWTLWDRIVGFNLMPEIPCQCLCLGVLRGS
jgi:hypothetical protein